MGNMQSAVYSKTKLYMVLIVPNVYSRGFGSNVDWLRFEARHSFLTLNV